MMKELNISHQHKMMELTDLIDMKRDHDSSNSINEWAMSERN
jgi:hypothetical protein